MDYLKVFNILEEQLDERGLLMDFDVHIAEHDEYYHSSIIENKRKPKALWMISINDSHCGDPFSGVDCSHIDFSYDVDRKLIRGIDIRLLSPLNENGYARHLVEIIEGFAQDFGCRGIFVGGVTNHSFWKHFGYNRMRARKSGRIYRVKLFLQEDF